MPRSIVPFPCALSCLPTAAASASFQSRPVADTVIRARACSGCPAMSSLASVALSSVTEDVSLARPRMAQTNENTAAPPSAFMTGVREVVEIAAGGDGRAAGDVEPKRERPLEVLERRTRQRSDRLAVPGELHLGRMVAAFPALQQRRERELDPEALGWRMVAALVNDGHRSIVNGRG
jgi:hypothetical protein